MADKVGRGTRLSVGSAIGFVVLFGFISLFSDMNYEGGRSMVGQYLKVIGATAAAVGVASGLGELVGYSLRFLSGWIADRSGRYWIVAIAGYLIQLFSLPALALVGRWEVAIVFVLTERIGKGIRNPSRDAMLSHAVSQTGRGFGFGLHEAMDQIGAFLGPIALSVILWVRTRAGGGNPQSIAAYHVAFAVLVVPAAIAVVILFVTKFIYPRPSDLDVKRPQIATKGYSKSYWIYLVATSLVAFGFADFPLIAYHFRAIKLMDEALIPTFYAVAMGVDALAALVFGRLYDRKGLPVMVVVFGMATFFAPFVFLGGVAAAAIGLALWGIGMGSQESIMRAAVADLVPSDKRGTAYGLFHTGFGILWFLGSALMGFLYDLNTYAIVIFSVLAQAASLPVFIIAARRRKAELSSLGSMDAQAD